MKLLSRCLRSVAINSSCRNGDRSRAPRRARKGVAPTADISPGMLPGVCGSAAQSQLEQAVEDR